MNRLYGMLAKQLKMAALPLFILILSLLVTALPARAEITLIFGTYTADKPTTTVRKYKPFLNYLEREMTTILGEQVTIKMKIASDYETGIDQLVNGEVDFARFGPASYVTAYQRNNGIDIVAMEAKKGKKRFKGIVAVHADNEMQNLSELSQHSFAFGNELSTIGRYLAQSHLIQAGITSHELSSYDYLGRHDRVGMAVGTGKYTAGALKESTFKKLVEKGVPIRALFEFDNVTKPWISAADLDPDVMIAMRQVMLGAADQAALKSVSKGGFLAGTDTDYDLIRDAIQHSYMF
ncbi:PhnD/SsuA/transferrin family substrate-binding protein [Roseovarius sp. EL26]|uniref:PhnD/SsuA/transferrin family substrate-binding protein n=1 Tax=Roseovarius sp. EL26 TaxID=2126672 RepID=UPI0013C4A5EF|nr:PhnD/SsuA/transferrin family substrate-binding protein [Roseovarius sp. EL26]